MSKTYTTREIVEGKQFKNYITAGQHKQFAKLGHLRTNSIKALQRALEADFIVERGKNKWTLTKRAGSLPPFKLDNRLTLGKTDVQIEMMVDFNNYISKLQTSLAGETDDSRVLIKTKTEWIYDSGLDKYMTDYTYDEYREVFDQISSLALGLDVRERIVVKVREECTPTVLSISEKLLVDEYKNEVLKQDGCWWPHFGHRLLNRNGYKELDSYVEQRFNADEWWYAYEIDLNKIEQRALISLN